MHDAFKRMHALMHARWQTWSTNVLRVFASKR